MRNLSSELLTFSRKNLCKKVLVFACLMLHTPYTLFLKHRSHFAEPTRKKRFLEATKTIESLTEIA